MVKLDILETLLAERGAGQAGLPAADRSLARLMIEDSDNSAATALWDAVGGASRIRAFNARAGLTRTMPSSCVECPGFPWPGWGLTTTTSAGQITLLRKLLAPTPLLSGADRRYALSLLENVTPAQRWGVSGGVPPAVTVALKDGWLPAQLIRHGTARIGTCQADPCDCVYVDRSRARTRRYCCDQCNDRAAAAAYRHLKRS